MSDRRTTLSLTPALPTCAWCRRPRPATGKYCGRKCRQSAFRLRRRASTGDDASLTTSSPTPGKFAYADPAYPGYASLYDLDHETDYAELAASLLQGNYTGFAISTSGKSLLDPGFVASMKLPPWPATFLCPWVKPIGVSSRTFGPHNTWEALIVVNGRRLRPGKRDWLRAMPARGGGTLIGRKPLAFCAFLFEMLGMLPGDELVDVFPGTGIVGRAWSSLSSGSGNDVSLTAGGERR